MSNGPLLAAIDLGSNSYRLEIARVAEGRLQVVESLKETVRQGGGLDDAGDLAAEAMERGWACLARFAPRLAGFAPHQVRAVATQALREARNRDVFLARARELLGLPVEVIPGSEEARLVYLGVAAFLPGADERRLVIDIGGGSTEVIAGRGHHVWHGESRPVGSVSLSLRHFPQGRFTREAFAGAEAEARALLRGAAPPASWERAYGSGGTSDTMAKVLAAHGMPDDVITLERLDAVMQALLRAGSAQQLQLPGLAEDLRPIIGGGVSMLRAALPEFGIDALRPAQGALRHGVLLDLVHAPAARAPRA